MQRFLQLITILVISSCKGQSDKSRTIVSDDFDKSPPLYYAMPEKLYHTDTSASWGSGDQQLLLTGTVYQKDGLKPAENVTIYYYQTNGAGRYVHKENEPRSVPPNKLGQTHGYIRGWVKTDKDGKYSIYTTRPGSYPSRDESAHVHVTVLDPYTNSTYYIDNFVFDDDPLLTTKERRTLENRAGSGIVRLVQEKGLQIAERDIYLGQNIPDYPIKSERSSSGREIGEDVFSFTPFHAWGPDKGSKTCPICKYGWYQGVLFFVGNNPDWDEVKRWLTYLEIESTQREKYLKVFFVYGNSNNFNPERRAEDLATIGRELALERIALTFVPSFDDQNSDIYLNEIDSNVSNTFLIYKRSKIIGKYVNLLATQENFRMLSEDLNSSINDYFYLPKPGQK